MICSLKNIICQSDAKMGRTNNWGMLLGEAFNKIVTPRRRRKQLGSGRRGRATFLFAFKHYNNPTDKRTMLREHQILQILEMESMKNYASTTSHPTNATRRNHIGTIVHSLFSTFFIGITNNHPQNIPPHIFSPGREL